MKEALVQIARYNAWANRRMIDALRPAPDEKLDAEMASSFPTLRTTVAHIRGAEHNWLQRLQLVEKPVWTGADVGKDFVDLVAQWTAASAGLLQFAEKQYNDKALLHVVEYRDLRGAAHKTPVYQVLQHVFNHSTYHRGQLVTMMRTAGITAIPQTDYIVYTRTGGK